MIKEDIGIIILHYLKCMTTDDHRAQVNFNMQMSKKEFGANSTPTFVIVNTQGEWKKIIGAHPYSTFEDIIESML